MDVNTFETNVMKPGIAFMQLHAPEIRWQREARVLMLAIAGQESDWNAREQAGNGPAHSFWQFERGGGVRGLVHHPHAGPILQKLCAAAGVAFEEHAIWDAMAKPEGDNLSVCMARLLLFTDPAAIPDPSDEDATWDYYRRNWRPGAPRPKAWPARIEAADAAVAPAIASAAPAAPSEVETG